MRYLLIAVVAAACSFGFYEAVNWVGITDQALTHGVIGSIYIEPAHTAMIGKVFMHIPTRWHEEIKTPEGDDWWTLDEIQQWEQTGVCVQVLYHRSRISHEFSASEISQEDCR